MLQHLTTPNTSAHTPGHTPDTTPDTGHVTPDILGLTLQKPDAKCMEAAR